MITDARRLITACLQRAFLQHACLIAAVLAIMAGIFGMHVMAGGNHAGHSPAIASAAAADSTDGRQLDLLTAAHVTAGHVTAAHVTAAAHVDHHGTAAAQVTSPEPGLQHSPLPELQSCTCSTDCSGAHTMGTDCIPSAKTGSLAAPQAPTGAWASNTGSGVAVTVMAAYAYLPESPSPGELPISRT